MTSQALSRRQRGHQSFPIGSSSRSLISSPFLKALVSSIPSTAALATTSFGSRRTATFMAVEPPVLLSCSLRSLRGAELQSLWAQWGHRLEWKFEVPEVISMVILGPGAFSPVPADAQALAVDRRPTPAMSPSEFQRMNHVADVWDGAFTSSGFSAVRVHG